MAPKKGLYPPIFRIDVEAARSFFGDGVKVDDIPQQIVNLYNTTKEFTAYSREGAVHYNGCQLSVYRNVTSRYKPSPWIEFFAPSGISITNANFQNQHFICFVTMGDELYAHTGGHSVAVFERFVDVSFPIEVARRIAMPEVKRARSSQLSGANLANDVNFRDPRRITYTESLENVWTALSGQMRSDLLADPQLKAVFGAKTRIRLEISSSIRLGPRVDTLDKLLNLIRWLASTADAPLPEDDEWAILDSIKVLNPRKSKDLIGRLKTHLAERVFIDHEYENLAIAHADASFFASASTYIVTKGTEEVYRGDARPELDSLVPRLQVSAAGATALLTEVAIRSTYDDSESNIGTFDTLLAHLNGEVRLDERTYFLLNGRWYEVDASYIDLVTRDLLGLIGNLDLDRSSIGMREWRSNEDEGTYNIDSVTAPTVINGDRVLTDNVELFDTLAFDGQRLHLIHVKKGFDVKIRDVRSQIINSANIIENDRRGAEPTRLKRHHAALVRNGRTTLDVAEFLWLFEFPRTYVLAYGTEGKVTSDTIDQFKSSVARMEVVTLAAQFRQVASANQDTQLRISWVEIVD
jgi:uncharacterized protein (TIGR04141 family)